MEVPSSWFVLQSLLHLAVVVAMPWDVQHLAVVVVRAVGSGIPAVLRVWGARAVAAGLIQLVVASTAVSWAASGR